MSKTEREWNSLLGQLRKERDLWRQYAELRGKLLAYYRCQSTPPGRLLDRLGRVRDKLAAVDDSGQESANG